MAPQALRARALRAKAWLFDAALPLWWANGFDTNARAFHERLGADGAPIASPRRIRVQARQTYVYAAAGALNWAGPWREAVNAGLDVLLERGLRSDGGVRHALDERGAPSDHRRDLYDLAFVAFALAKGGRAVGRPEAIDASQNLIDWAYDAWSLPQGGLAEGDIAVTPPRRQNPHMHLLEALLAIAEITPAPRNLARAAALVSLAERSFIDQSHGVLLEYFTDDWRPMPGPEGAVFEPGHQAEWRWLLARFADASRTPLSPAAPRLLDRAEAMGVRGGFFVDEVMTNGDLRLSTARLWPQTERLKANLAAWEETGEERNIAAAAAAYDALMRYGEGLPPGLWRDRYGQDGAFVEEPSPASSFYHIMLALAELIRVAEAA